MATSKEIRSRIQPSEQLELLKLKCKKISPDLYKIYAFYLELVRKNLLNTVKSSLFYLITEQIKINPNFSSQESRRIFQTKIDQLVSENISFLTVEHLTQLAENIRVERQMQIKHTKEKLVNAIDKRKNNSLNSLIENSIELSSSPPIEDLSRLDSWEGEIQAPYTIKMDESHEDKNHKKIEDDLQNNDIRDRNNENLPNHEEISSLEFRNQDIEILQSIFVLAEDDDDFDEEEKSSANVSNSDPCLEKNSGKSLMPNNPLGLFEWLESLENALIRRLRNLSHSINIELLRSGLVNTLIPLSLLDAVISGQVASNNSVSNILSLKLPLNNSYGGEGVDIDCLLISPSDMEFDNPQLRKSKLHIKNYRQVLIKMIKQERYWQSRSLAEEVRQEWWKTSAET